MNSKVWIDYDNDGNFDVSELILTGSHAANNADSVSFVVPNTATLNEFLRVRAVLDLAIPTDACYAPQYGQVEDYSVYLYTPGEITSGVVKTQDVFDLSVYPNPAGELVNISFDYTGTEDVQVSIRDLQGRLVVQESMTGANNIRTQFDVSNFQSGIYNVSIQNTKGIVTQNFVVK